MRQNMTASHTIQMLGLIGAASYIAARLARRSGRLVFHRYAIVAQPRAGLPAMPRGFTVCELGPQELAGHLIDIAPDVQARRFAEGLTCLAAFDTKQRLTGLIWLREHRHDEDEVAVRFLLPTDACWDTGLWIAPEYRMGRTFAALWAGAGGWMDARGLTHSLSRINDYNLPALLSHKRMSARVLAHRIFVQLGGWQWSASTQPRLVKLGGKAGAEMDLRGVLARAV